MEENKKQERAIDQAVGQFNEVREDGIYELATQEAWRANLENMVAACAVADEEELKRVKELCIHIIQSLKAGNEKNMEINLIQKMQKYQRNQDPLGTTVIKIVSYEKNIPAYIYVDKEIGSKSIIYLSEDEGKAYLVYEDKDDALKFVKLAEVHLLSMSPFSQPYKEIGMLTSFTWIPGKIFSSKIMGSNLIPIQNLLLVDALPKRNTECVEKREVAINGEK